MEASCDEVGPVVWQMGCLAVDSDNQAKPRTHFSCGVGHHFSWLKPSPVLKQKGWDALPSQCLEM